MCEMFFSLRIQSLFSHLHDSLLVYSRVSFFSGVLVSRCIEFGEKIAIVAGRTKANRTNSASHGNVEKSED